MTRDQSSRLYRQCYARLLQLYPKEYRERFAESMEQTCGDLLRERTAGQAPLFRCALWMFAETTTGIVREHMATTLAKYRGVLRVALVTGLLLLVPLVATQVSDEFNWTGQDFVAAGFLLFSAGMAFQLLIRQRSSSVYRAAVTVAVGSSLFLIWANLAVGLIGSENEPANGMYMAVLAVAIIGATLARLRPRGMSLTLFAMAATQTLIAAIALLTGMQHLPESSVGEILNVNGLFVVFFVVAGLLFRYAAEEDTGQKTDR